jgi:hypothetical protein
LEAEGDNRKTVGGGSLWFVYTLGSSAVRVVRPRAYTCRPSSSSFFDGPRPPAGFRPAEFLYNLLDSLTCDPYLPVLAQPHGR